jgi:hypothetical protein
MTPNDKTTLLVEKGKGRQVISVNKLFLYVSDNNGNNLRAFDLVGLRKWLTTFFKTTERNRNIEVTANSDMSFKVPKYSTVHLIRLKGTAMDITVTYNGRTYTVDSCSTAREIQPRTQYAETEQTMTITATVWGELNIIVVV